MIDELKRIYRGVAVHATEDEEHEAALTVLVLMMMSDGKFRLDEQSEIETFVDDVEWESDTFSLSTRLGPATARAREAHGDRRKESALIAAAHDQIASRVLRAELLAACEAVADADNERAKAEDSLLAVIRRQFA